MEIKGELNPARGKNITISSGQTFFVRVMPVDLAAHEDLYKSYCRSISDEVMNKPRHESYFELGKTAMKILEYSGNEFQAEKVALDISDVREIFRVFNGEYLMGE